MVGEPVSGEVGHFFEFPLALEQVARALDHRQLLLAIQLLEGLAATRSAAVASTLILSAVIL
jgi:hypothetical protein